MSMGSNSSAAARRLRLLPGGARPSEQAAPVPAPDAEVEQRDADGALSGQSLRALPEPEPQSGSLPCSSSALKSGVAHTPLPVPQATVRPARSAEAQAAAEEDADWVSRAQAGERLAFELLYRRHAGFAMNLAVRIQGSATDVEDVVHDAFMKAHSRLGDLREAAAFRSWLGAIVVRLVRSRLRRRRLMATLGLANTGDAVDLDAIASSDAGPEARAQLAQVYALLQTMPTEDRIAWTLRNVEHHRLESVAQLAECSLATAKRRIARAQRFFEQHFVSERVSSPGNGVS